jgi:hypothetical protein
VSDSDITTFNWHPYVHVHEFSEQLYFYLLRLDRPLHSPVHDQIRHLLDLAEIEWACEYSIFGYWDAIIRVWLTDPSRHRFERILRSGQANIGEARYFTANEIRHLWLDRVSTPLSPADDLLAESPARHKLVGAIADYEQAITQLADNPTQPIPRDSPLVRAGIIFERPPPPPGAVKFYVSLHRTEGELSLNRELNIVLSALRQSGLAADASLYVGSGSFAEYLVRGVSPDYETVLATTAAFDVALADTSLRCMTHLIANTHARESDNVNDVRGLSPEEERNAIRLGLSDSGSDGSKLNELPKREREALGQLLDEASRMWQENPKLRESLVALFRACIANEHADVRASLSFFLESEYLAAQYLARVLSDVFTPAWPRVLSDRFHMLASDVFERSTDMATEHEMNAAEVSRPREWTLGSIAKLATAIADLNADFNRTLATELCVTWKPRLWELVRVRNFIAHGRTREVHDFSAFHLDGAESWGANLREIIRAAELHYMIERAFETRINIQQEG